jgi:hypothetical protein
LRSAKQPRTDEKTLIAHVNPSCWEVREVDTPIFFTFVDMRFENKPIHAVLKAEITFVIRPVMLVSDFRV